MEAEVVLIESENEADSVEVAKSNEEKSICNSSSDKAIVIDEIASEKNADQDQEDVIMVERCEEQQEDDQNPKIESKETSPQNEKNGENDIELVPIESSMQPESEEQERIVDQIETVTTIVIQVGEEDKSDSAEKSTYFDVVSISSTDEAPSSTDIRKTGVQDAPQDITELIDDEPEDFTVIEEIPAKSMEDVTIIDQIPAKSMEDEPEKVSAQTITEVMDDLNITPQDITEISKEPTPPKKVKIIEEIVITKQPPEVMIDKENEHQLVDDEPNFNEIQEFINLVETGKYDDLKIQASPKDIPPTKEPETKVSLVTLPGKKGKVKPTSFETMDFIPLISDDEEEESNTNAKDPEPESSFLRVHDVPFKENNANETAKLDENASLNVLDMNISKIDDTQNESQAAADDTVLVIDVPCDKPDSVILIDDDEEPAAAPATLFSKEKNNKETQEDPIEIKQDPEMKTEADDGK